MNNLQKRIITSTILLLIISISLFYDKKLWLFFLIIVSLILFIEFNNLIKKIWKNKKNTITRINFISLIFLAIIIFIGYDLYSKPPISLMFIFLICIFSDTGGYVIGNLIGGKKLTKISPKKTISGSIGSFIFSLFSIIILWSYDNFTEDYNFVTNNFLKLIPTCLFLSLICQLGDLFISYFKRKAKVNDTGSILPGHGGLLDRSDGVIFVIPVAYLVDKVFF
ncbi:phosphatidate cytidylyltransferase [Candidatus Pelagibacter sp.]|nr:phosphatidate cytidylyltransferase [Candidatus Pelagibacter sp.]